MGAGSIAGHGEFVRPTGPLRPGELATLPGLKGFLEAATLAELPRLVDQQTLYYNRERRHSPVDKQRPLAYLESEGIPA